MAFQAATAFLRAQATRLGVMHSRLIFTISWHGFGTVFRPMVGKPKSRGVSALQRTVDPVSELHKHHLMDGDDEVCSQITTNRLQACAKSEKEEVG